VADQGLACGRLTEDLSPEQIERTASEFRSGKLQVEWLKLIGMLGCRVNNLIGCETVDLSGMVARPFGAHIPSVCFSHAGAGVQRGGAGCGPAHNRQGRGDGGQHTIALCSTACMPAPCPAIPQCWPMLSGLHAPILQHIVFMQLPRDLERYVQLLNQQSMTEACEGEGSQVTYSEPTCSARCS